MRTGLLLCTAVALAAPAPGYFHVPPQTLKEMCDQSEHVRALSVKACDPDKGVVAFDVADVVRSERKSGVTSFRLVVRPGAVGAEAVLGKLAVGKAAVLFSREYAREGKNASGFGYVFVDEDAFCVDYNAAGEYWLFLRPEPGLSVTFHGPAKELPGLVKAVLKGEQVKVPTKAPATPDDYRTRGLVVDEARRRNSPTYPKTPLPTAWGKPVKGLQAGVRVNPAVDIPGAAAVVEVVVRNLGTKPVTFSHLQLEFGGDDADGVVTGKGTEAVSQFAPKGSPPGEPRLAVLLSPGEAYPLATLPVFRPGEGKDRSRSELRLRVGDNQVGAEQVVVRPGDGGRGKDVELATGHLDVRVPPKP